MRPLLANYYVTYRCNASCGFCDIWEQPSPLIDTADAERNLDDLQRLGVKIIDFTGGEPLLHPAIGDLLRMAKERGFITTLTTNGLLYPKRSAALAGKVDMLHFSIDSSVREEHDRSRGVACFDALMESIRVALAKGESPDLLFTVTPHNVHRLREVYDRISYPNRLMLIINPLFAYKDSGDELSEEVMSAAQAVARLPYTYLNPAFLSLRRSGGNDPERPVCRAVSTCVVISPFDELVLPCYHYGLERVPIEGRLFDLWHSDAVARHRALEGRHEVCRGCSINCYFEPSFAVSPESRYFWQSLPSKFSYSWTKFIVQRLRARLGGREAILPELTPPVPQSGDGLPAGEKEMLDLPVLEPSVVHGASERSGTTPPKPR